MIFLSFLLFTLIIFIPLLLCFWKRTTIQRETHNEAAEFYQTQLTSLKHDYDAKLINATDYENTRIEIQRRLLHNNITPPQIGDINHKSHGVIILSTIAIIPLFAAILYSINGVPFFAAQSAQPQNTQPGQAPIALLKKLELEVSHIQPNAPDYLSKNLLLGQLEEQMGMIDQAIFHLNQGLNAHFTPELALHIAELQTQRDGHISTQALSLYHKALDAAPPQAPWRMAVEERIAAGEHEQDQRTMKGTY